MTTAFCNALGKNPSPTYEELLQLMHRELAAKRFSQKPQLSSSQRFDADRIFHLQDAVPNSNPKLGRVFRQRFPPQPRSMEEFGPLGDMLGPLLGMAVGMVALEALDAVVGENPVSDMGRMLLRGFMSF